MKCSRHKKASVSRGGLQADLIDDHFIDGISSLSIKELWIACDTDGSIWRFKKAMSKLATRLDLGKDTRNKINCYALVGDEMAKNESRLQEIYQWGAMPFAQLFQPIGADDKKEYSTDWKRFHRRWSRPAATKAHCEKGTDFRNFNT